MVMENKEIKPTDLIGGMLLIGAICFMMGMFVGVLI